MRKFFLLILLMAIIGGFFGISYAKNSISPEKKNILSSSLPEVISTPAPKEEVIEKPQTLSIPKLGVNATIESVGMDQEGRMDVPKKWQNVAWYNLGYKIGSKGSAVIAGHLDTVTGAPAVFYNLNKLEVGDEINIQGEDKRKMIFKVVDKKIYNADQFPVSEVFGVSAKPRLNLITCQGVFNQQRKAYNNRTVVYTELVDYLEYH